MSASIERILEIEVPIIVRLGTRPMSLGEVVALVPGTILELSKRADDDLELLVNNKPIGAGAAVKVGENFGLRLSYVGDAKERITAMGPMATTPLDDEEDVAAMAAKFLDGQ